MSETKASILVDMENVVGYFRNQELPYECQGSALNDHIVELEKTLETEFGLTQSLYLQKTFYGNVFAGRVRSDIGELSLGRGYQVIHSPFATEKRGSITDGIMIADAIEIIAGHHEPKPTHIVLVTGDIDIIWPILLKARKYQTEVIVATFRKTISQNLVPYIETDNIIYLDDLVNIIAYHNALQNQRSVFDSLKLHPYPKNGSGTPVLTTEQHTETKPFKLAPSSVKKIMEHITSVVETKTMTKRQLEIDLSDMFMNRPPKFDEQVYNFLLRENYIEIVDDNVNVL